jgi:predicted dehydrogenase
MKMDNIGKANKKVRIGLLGAGQVIREIHLPVIKNISNAEIIWICDVSREAAESAISAYAPDAKAHTSIDDCEDVDVVLVTIPVGIRKDPLLKVIGRGWNVLCEKPFAVTLSEHDEYLLKANEARINVGAGLMRRYYRPTCIAKDVLRAGVLGEVQEVWASQGGKVIRTGRENHYQSDKKSSGGGVLMETGVHLVDQVFAILGVESFKIVDVRQTVFNGLDYETSAAADLSLAYQKNVRFNLELSNLRDLYFGIVVRTTQAVLKIGVFAESPVTLCSIEGKMIADLQGDKGANMVYQAFHMEWTDFIRQCTSSDYKSAISAETARTTTGFIETCYGSASQSVISRASEGK